MLAGTKTSVDHLMPKSEELLSQSQRQERAISNIHNDLTEKTNAIINELSQVKYFTNDSCPKRKFMCIIIISWTYVTAKIHLMFN